ncbi:MAG: glycosyltransferase family 4 protein [Acidimicrobiales bacterium]
MGVHQFLATLLPGDATGQHAFGIRRCLRDAGWRSEIFAEAVHDDLVGEARYFTDYAATASPGDVLIYQMTTATPVSAFLAARKEPLIVDYHNITPPELYEPWEPAVAQRNRYAREELAQLAQRSAVGVGDSEFNRSELEDVGFKRTGVLPLLIDLNRLDAADTEALAELQRHKLSGGTDLLFVGRLVPNKAQHDLVKALWVYRRYFDPDARLWLLGRPSCAPYASALASLVADLGLGDAVQFRLEASDAVLAAYYRAADLFVCASEHEGFCIPILEAMHSKLPVVAYASSAIPETLQDAGVLLESKSAAMMAAAFDYICSRRKEFLSALEPAMRARVDAFSIERAKASVLDLVNEVAQEMPR